MELKAGRKTKTYLFQIFCKVKDRTQRVSKSYKHDREVHVCGYVVDGVESKRIRCSMILSLPSYILGMANSFLFLHGPSCVHHSFFSWAFMCPFYQYIAHALIGEDFGRDFMEYGTSKMIRMSGWYGNAILPVWKFLHVEFLHVGVVCT